MTQAVKDLIATATALAIYATSDELKGAVSALEALGDEAKGSTNEYKELKALVEKADGEKSKEAKAEEARLKEEAEAKAKADAEAKAKADAEAKAEKPKKKLKYKGIRQMGALWYSIEDNYTKSFSTADECAEHFNG